MNILWTFACGTQFDRRYSRISNLFDLMDRRTRIFDINGGILNQMPWLRFIAPEKTGYNLIKRLNEDLFELLIEEVEIHLNNYSKDKARDDLIYAFIKEMKKQENNPNSTFTKRQLVMIILDIFFAGATTTSTAVDLALMSLLMYPDIQQRCREEIEKHPDVTYADRHLVPYTVATLLEAQRFFPIAPIAGIRRVQTDCTLRGYAIPKNATVLYGLKSVLEDKEFWGDPEVFRPERFLNDETQINKTLKDR